MVNLLAVKMIVLIIVTKCYIVYFQYALFVSIHWVCLFLSYCGILMDINSLQHIVTQRFVQIQHPFDLMLFLLFFLESTGCLQGTGFSLHHYRACSLYNCLCELHPCTHYMGNYTKRTLSI